MSKQKFEHKKVLSICGVLDKDESGEYIVNIYTKDDYQTVSLVDILDSILGQEINISSETEIY